MTAQTVEVKLEDVLAKIDNRLERIESELTDIKVSQAEIRGDIANLKTELTLTRDDVKDLKNSQRTQIWALILTVIGATITAVIKFGFFPNP
jgi:chromosome segregation ATPase